MSRFPELFGEAIDEVVIGEAFLVETLAEHIARHIVSRQQRSRAEVRIEAQYPLGAPHAGHRPPDAGHGDAGRHRGRLPTRVRRVVGVEAGASTPVRARREWCGSGAERLLEAGFGEATSTGSSSSCRSRPTTSAGQGTLLVGTEKAVNAEQLVDIVEQSMSSPVYEL